jgi:diadenosine tetraphosphatase ApaH/serine/threonine PP2A family protein phosphatase
MKRVAVISDVHGNDVALETVLADIDALGVDAIWCLGDVVGYGPQPTRCCELVRVRADLCLVGNHDLAALGKVPTEDFNPDAAAATEWTRAALSEEARAWLDSLAPTATADGVQLFHASPLDPVWDYVLTAEGALLSLRLTDAPVVLVGHSHVPLAISLDGDELAGGYAPGGHEVELNGARWLLNPGSVGQPRDGDARAAWLCLDLPSGRAEFRRLEYPICRVQQQMREAGLPSALADRLAHGV